MSEMSKVSNPGVQLVFCTPTLDHRVSTEFMRSMIETEWLVKDVPHGFLTRGGDCFVAKARNKCVTEFLRAFPDGEQFFFLDDDIGWPAEKVVEFIRSPVDVIAGIYPKKSEQMDFPVELEFDMETGKFIRYENLIRATMVPTGFMRIRRHVLERLAKDAAIFKDMEQDGTAPEYYGIFESGISEGWWWGEDYTFCRKWRAMGGQLWVDPDIKFTHRGSKKWEATLSEHMPAFERRAELAQAHYKAEQEKTEAVA